MNKDDLLYHYFSNSLTKAQEEHMQNLLATDAEFKTQFDFENNLKRVVKEERRDALRLKLNQFEADLKPDEKTKKPAFSFLKIAASIAVFLTAGWFGYQSFFGVNYADLYTDNYKTYPNTVFAITRSDTINSVEREAFVAYEAEDYNKALDKFNEAETQDYFAFYKAQSYLKLNNLSEAKSLFESIIQKNLAFKAEAYWYLALINLKEADTEQAVFHLKKLVSGFDYKKAEAEQLIEKLK